MTPVKIDTTALHSPVTKQEKQRYKSPKKSGCGPFGTLGAILIPLVIVGMIINAVAVSQGGLTLPWVVLYLVIAAALIGVAVLISISGGTKRVQRYKFAEANGFIYHETESVSRLRGILFGPGRSHRNSEVFQMHGNVRLGNYQYTTGSGKNSRTHHWRYMEIPLPRNVPHLVLDSTDNNSIFGTNLPVGLHKSQRVELEGDFSNYFTVFAPSGYGVDLRYLLPPETMALLIDNLQRFDLEFIDDRLVLIENGSWSLHDDEPWRFAEWAINVLHPHIVARTDRYVDDRVAQSSSPSAVAHQGQGRGQAQQFASTGTVASGGRRLKRAFPIGTVVFIVVIAALVFLPRLLT